jgi:dihydropteroate synthase
MLKEMTIGGNVFSFGKKTYIMGILNVTPDSFSDGGNFREKEKALRHAEELIRAGADILDIGGESTHPGYQMISAQEEIERLLPVLSAVKERFGIPVSVDTYKAEVALEAARGGADLLNDIWGFRFETHGVANGAYQKLPLTDGISPMALAAAKTGLPVCLMHNKTKAVYGDFAKDIMEELQESLAMAEKAGVCREKIILDPGVGFGKTYENNLWCIHHLEEFNRFGLPVLLGASRKSVIGLTLDLPVDQREEGTLAASVIAVMKGCAFLRVHDVEANKRAVRMAEAVLSAE